MKRLMEKTVFSGLVTAWRLATVPTRRSPPLVKATTDGVVRPPSAFSMTVGSPPSRTAMHEFVVPRSMPIVLPMSLQLLAFSGRNLSVSVVDLAQKSRPAAGASAPQRTARALGRAGVARAAPVAQQIHVQLQLLARRGEGEHRVVQLLERRAGAQQAQPHADARDVRVDRDVVQAVGEQQHACRRLAPDARQRA